MYRCSFQPEKERKTYVEEQQQQQAFTNFFLFIFWPKWASVVLLRGLTYVNHMNLSFHIRVFFFFFDESD